MENTEDGKITIPNYVDLYNSECRVNFMGAETGFKLSFRAIRDFENDMSGLMVKNSKLAGVKGNNPQFNFNSLALDVFNHNNLNFETATCVLHRAAQKDMKRRNIALTRKDVEDTLEELYDQDREAFGQLMDTASWLVLLQIPHVVATLKSQEEDKDETGGEEGPLATKNS